MEPERIDNLRQHIANGTLIRNAWTDGQEKACLLAALSPEAGKAEKASACPASVMPPWLAELTPWIDDDGTLAEWSGMVRRYAVVAARWHALSKLDWEKLFLVTLRIIVVETGRRRLLRRRVRSVRSGHLGAA